MMEKVKRTYMLERQTVDKIEHLASRTRRSKSAIIDEALEAYAKSREDLLTFFRTIAKDLPQTK